MLEFFDWLVDNHFTFLGLGIYNHLPKKDKGDGVEIKMVEGLGVLRDSTLPVLGAHPMGGSALELLMRPQPILFSRSTGNSRVRRRIPMDVVVIKDFNDQGEVVGELRLVGLFSSAALKASTLAIPLLREKVRRVRESSGLYPQGYNGKMLLQCLEDYPRDDLFAHSEEEILETAMGVVGLHIQRRVALFARHDQFGRYVACQIYVPQERFSQSLRQKLENLVAENFGGKITHSSIFFRRGLFGQALLPRPSYLWRGRRI